MQHFFSSENQSISTIVKTNYIISRPVSKLKQAAAAGAAAKAALKEAAAVTATITANTSPQPTNKTTNRTGKLLY